MPAIAALFEAGSATITATCCLRWQRKEDDAELQRRQNDQTGRRVA
jgi:hypothetical protein